MNPLRSTLLSILRSRRSAKVAGAEDDTVWHLHGNGAEVEALRSELLAAALASGEPLVLAYDEELDEPELAEHVVPAGEGIFELKPGAPVEPLRRWLEPGNWDIFSPGLPSGALKLAWAKPGEIRAFVSEHGVHLIIDSFHDDAPWMVALGGTSQHD